MRRILMALLAAWPGLAAADAAEWGFELRFQPDDTGMSTTSKSVRLEDGELEIEESGETRDRLVERNATDAEAALLMALVTEALAAVRLEPGGGVARPHVEVILEWESGDTEVEITRLYPAGAVPADIVAAQRAFFETVYD